MTAKIKRNPVRKGNYLKGALELMKQYWNYALQGQYYTYKIACYKYAQIQKREN